MGKKIIDLCLHRLLSIKWHWELNRQYKKILKLNKIVGTNIENEKKWLAKWRAFNIPISHVQYRVFRRYIGDNINIVPEEVCHLLIEPILNSKMAAGYYGDKNFFDKLLPMDYMPRTILRKVRGFFYDIDYNPVDLYDSKLYELLSLANTSRIILKPSVDGESGRGVLLFDFFEKEQKWKARNSQDVLTVSFLINHCGDDIIIQESIEQHTDISFFNDSSVNTLRLGIYKSVKDDKSHVIGSIMRIGASGSIVDNAHCGGCFVGIAEDGKLAHTLCNQYGQTFTVFNGIDFTKDYFYPEWEKVLSFAKDISERIIHHRLLALDIVVDKTGNPRLIEFNAIPGTFSTWLFQFTTGAAFGIYTDEVLEYCIDKIKRMPLYSLKN